MISLGVKKLCLMFQHGSSLFNELANKAKIIQIKAENFFSKLKDEEGIQTLKNLAIEKLSFMSERINEYELFHSSVTYQHNISHTEYKQAIPDPKLDRIAQIMETNDELMFQHNVKEDELKRKGRKIILDTKNK